MKQVQIIPEIINDPTVDTIDEFTELDATQRLVSLFDVLIEIDFEINGNRQKGIIYDNI